MFEFVSWTQNVVLSTFRVRFWGSVTGVSFSGWWHKTRTRHPPPHFTVSVCRSNGDKEALSFLDNHAGCLEIWGTPMKHGRSCVAHLYTCEAGGPLLGDPCRYITMKCRRATRQTRPFRCNAIPIWAHWLLFCLTAQHSSPFWKRGGYPPVKPSNWSLKGYQNYNQTKGWSDLKQMAMQGWDDPQPRMLMRIKGPQPSRLRKYTIQDLTRDSAK